MGGGKGGTREGEKRNPGWLQRCGYESAAERFFWFLVGSRPTGGLTGNRRRRPAWTAGAFFQDFLPWRVSWPVVGVRMRLARREQERESWQEGKGGTRARPKGLRDRGKRVNVELLGY